MRFSYFLKYLQVYNPVACIDFVRCVTNGCYLIFFQTKLCIITEIAVVLFTRNCIYLVKVDYHNILQCKEMCVLQIT
jgi:hypothetical protein